MTKDASGRYDNAELMNMIGLVSALTAAQSTGLLEALLGTPASAVECAARLGLDARATERILDVLTAGGILERTGDRFRASASFAATAQITPGGLAMLFGLFGHTPAFLRTGQPIARMDAGATEREAAYRKVTGDLGRMFADAADHLAQQVGGQPRAILDVGCGSGVWSLAIARRSPDGRVTGLDFPGVLEEAFVPRAMQLGLGNRVERLAGDMQSVELPADHFDLAVIANVLRLEPADRARQLIGRVARAVRSGGHLLIVDALAEGSPAAELARAVYSLHLALRTTSGRPHSPAEIRGWMTEAGLVDIRAMDCGTLAGATSALYARRP